ncbi:cation transport protein-domain-containing protein [Pilobolus umbonatus]|nr:cation transport protein-domain-containing protein [Pilobolus umbonatus]
MDLISHLKKTSYTNDSAYLSTKRHHSLTVDIELSNKNRSPLNEVRDELAVIESQHDQDTASEITYSDDTHQGEKGISRQDSSITIILPINECEKEREVLDRLSTLSYGRISSCSVNDIDHPASNSHGIAFAEDVEEQREIARKRLEKDRELEDAEQRGVSFIHDTHEEIDENRTTEIEDNELKRIMREPIYKSDLTKEQKCRIGGAEYRALNFLAYLVPGYYLFCLIGFAVFMRIYFATSSYAQEVLKDSNIHSSSKTWLFSFFVCLSSFNNLGLMPTYDSMQPFQKAPVMLVMNMILILAGNTAYAILLRMTIWIIYRLTPKKYGMRREALRYLLDHPRRCYTTLFPATQTKWLLITLLTITVVEFVSFISLNYWLPVLHNIEWGYRILDGLYQSVATRSAGQSIVDLMSINPGTQIVFIVAMYIGVYPVSISMRHSNVYQERALGIYRGENEDDINHSNHAHDDMNIHGLKRQTTLTSVMTTSRKLFRKPDFYVMTQIQRQLTSEICWVIGCIFIICVIEAESIMSISPITVGSIIYECVSAFGTVGSSIGYPERSESQSGHYHPLSLPAAIDRAVLLPSEQLEQEEEHLDIIRKRNASFSGVDVGRTRVYNGSRTL